MGLQKRNKNSLLLNYSSVTGYNIRTESLERQLTTTKETVYSLSLLLRGTLTHAGCKTGNSVVSISSLHTTLQLPSSSTRGRWIMPHAAPCVRDHLCHLALCDYCHTVAGWLKIVISSPSGSLPWSHVALSADGRNHPHLVCTCKRSVGLQ
jgi:hypothetical protein